MNDHLIDIFRFGHFVGFVLWGMGLAGSLAAAQVAGAGNLEGMRKARKVLMQLAHPGMGLAFVGGIGMIVSDPTLLKEHWLHGKFFLLALLVAITVAHGKALRSGSFTEPKGQRFGFIARWVTIVILALTVFKPF